MSLPTCRPAASLKKQRRIVANINSTNYFSALAFLLFCLWILQLKQLKYTMSLSTPLEQTYLKVPCSRCGQVTPHRDNSTTTQCEVCYTSNFPLSVKTEYYSGWELAFFWQQKYRAVVGYGITAHRNYPVEVLYSQAPAYNVALAEPIEGGMLVSKMPPLPLNEGFATDYTALREEIRREPIDPNSIGTL